jgi:peptidoglycan hydrolase CwlO-like protein
MNYVERVIMKKTTLMSGLCLLLVIIFIGSISCGGGDTVTKESYDALKAQLAAAQAQVSDLQAKVAAAPVIPTLAGSGDQALKDEITSLKANITQLGTQITELNKKADGLTQEKATLSSQYAALNTKYQDLAAATTPETITEELVENEIFKLLNQERVKAGLPAFEFGKQLYNQARTNSNAMAAAGKAIASPDYLYQETFMAAFYTSVNTIARGAVVIWKLNTYTFEHGTLLAGNKYAGVGAVKSGDVIFITYLAAFYP